MNRNKVFLLSYIAFMITSVIVRCYYDYPLWNNIVIAVTISGPLFAYAEMFKTFYEDIKTYKEKKLKQCDSLLTKTRDVNSVIDNLLSRDNSPEDEQHYKSQKNITQKNIKSLEKMKLLDSKFPLDKYCQIVYYCTLFVAFFSLLCIIVFEPLAKELINVQSYATVISFVLILLTPFVSDCIKRTALKREKSGKKLEEAVSALEDFYKEELEHHAN